MNNFLVKKSLFFFSIRFMISLSLSFNLFYFIFILYLNWQQLNNAWNLEIKRDWIFFRYDGLYSSKETDLKIVVLFNSAIFLVQHSQHCLLSTICWRLFHMIGRFLYNYLKYRGNEFCIFFNSMEIISTFHFSLTLNWNVCIFTYDIKSTQIETIFIIFI